MDKITVYAPAVSSVLTVNGTATGYVEVADNTPFYRGALVNLRDATGLTLECVITEIDVPSGTKIGLKAINSRGFTRSDLSAYLVANTATLHMPAQILAGYTEDVLAHCGMWSG